MNKSVSQPRYRGSHHLFWTIQNKLGDVWHSLALAKLKENSATKYPLIECIFQIFDKKLFLIELLRKHVKYLNKFCFLIDKML